MKTAKGNNYKSLLGIHTGYKVLTLELKDTLPFDTTAGYLQTMRETIAARIILNTKPAGTLQKQLERIEHHREQMLDAYTELFRCYQGMTEPQSRQSPIDKARTEMLQAIPDSRDGQKMLRQMCSLHLGERADSYVLPDDKAGLIAATVAAMRAADNPVKASTVESQQTTEPTVP